MDKRTVERFYKGAVWHEFFSTEKKDPRMTDILDEKIRYFKLHYPFLQKKQVIGKAYEDLKIPHYFGIVDRGKLHKLYLEARKTEIPVTEKPDTVRSLVRKLPLSIKKKPSRQTVVKETPRADIQRIVRKINSFRVAKTSASSKSENNLELEKSLKCFKPQKTVRFQEDLEIHDISPCVTRKSISKPEEKDQSKVKRLIVENRIQKIGNTNKSISDSGMLNDKNKSDEQSNFLREFSLVKNTSEEEKSNEEKNNEESAELLNIEADSEADRMIEVTQPNVSKCDKNINSPVLDNQSLIQAENGTDEEECIKTSNQISNLETEEQFDREPQNIATTVDKSSADFNSVEMNEFENLNELVVRKNIICDIIKTNSSISSPDLNLKIKLSNKNRKLKTSQKNEISVNKSTAQCTSCTDNITAAKDSLELPPTKDGKIVQNSSNDVNIIDLTINNMSKDADVIDEHLHRIEDLENNQSAHIDKSEFDKLKISSLGEPDNYDKQALENNLLENNEYENNENIINTFLILSSDFSVGSAQMKKLFSYSDVTSNSQCPSQESLKTYVEDKDHDSDLWSSPLIDESVSQITESDYMTSGFKKIDTSYVRTSKIAQSRDTDSSDASFHSSLESLNNMIVEEQLEGKVLKDKKRTDNERLTDINEVNNIDYIKEERSANTQTSSISDRIKINSDNLNISQIPADTNKQSNVNLFKTASDIHRESEFPSETVIPYTKSSIISLNIDNGDLLHGTPLSEQDPEDNKTLDLILKAPQSDIVNEDSVNNNSNQEEVYEIITVKEEKVSQQSEPEIFSKQIEINIKQEDVSPTSSQSEVNYSPGEISTSYETDIETGKLILNRQLSKPVNSTEKVMHIQDYNMSAKSEEKYYNISSKGENSESEYNKELNISNWIEENKENRNVIILKEPTGFTESDSSVCDEDGDINETGYGRSTEESNGKEFNNIYKENSTIKHSATNMNEGTGENNEYERNIMAVKNDSCEDSHEELGNTHDFKMQRKVLKIKQEIYSEKKRNIENKINYNFENENHKYGEERNSGEYEKLIEDSLNNKYFTGFQQRSIEDSNEKDSNSIQKIRHSFITDKINLATGGNNEYERNIKTMEDSLSEDSEEAQDFKIESTILKIKQEICPVEKIDIENEINYKLKYGEENITGEYKNLIQDAPNNEYFHNSPKFDPRQSQEDDFFLKKWLEINNQLHDQNSHDKMGDKDKNNTTNKIKDVKYGTKEQGIPDASYKKYCLNLITNSNDTDSFSCPGNLPSMQHEPSNTEESILSHSYSEGTTGYTNILKDRRNIITINKLGNKVLNPFLTTDWLSNTKKNSNLKDSTYNDSNTIHSTKIEKEDEISHYDEDKITNRSPIGKIASFSQDIHTPPKSGISYKIKKDVETDFSNDYSIIKKSKSGSSDSSEILPPLNRKKPCHEVRKKRAQLLKQNTLNRYDNGLSSSPEEDIVSRTKYRRKKLLIDLLSIPTTVAASNLSKNIKNSDFHSSQTFLCDNQANLQNQNNSQSETIHNSSKNDAVKHENIKEELNNLPDFNSYDLDNSSAERKTGITNIHSMTEPKFQQSPYESEEENIKLKNVDSYKSLVFSQEKDEGGSNISVSKESFPQNDHENNSKVNLIKNKSRELSKEIFVSQKLNASGNQRTHSQAEIHNLSEQHKMMRNSPKLSWEKTVSVKEALNKETEIRSLGGTIYIDNENDTIKEQNNSNKLTLQEKASTSVSSKSPIIENRKDDVKNVSCQEMIEGKFKGSVEKGTFKYFSDSTPPDSNNEKRNDLIYIRDKETNKSNTNKNDSEIHLFKGQKHHKSPSLLLGNMSPLKRNQERQLIQEIHNNNLETKYKGYLSSQNENNEEYLSQNNTRSNLELSESLKSEKLKMNPINNRTFGLKTAIQTKYTRSDISNFIMNVPNESYLDEMPKKRRLSSSVINSSLHKEQVNQQLKCFEEMSSSDNEILECTPEKNTFRDINIKQERGSDNKKISKGGKSSIIRWADTGTGTLLSSNSSEVETLIRRTYFMGK